MVLTVGQQGDAVSLCGAFAARKDFPVAKRDLFRGLEGHLADLLVDPSLNTDTFIESVSRLVAGAIHHEPEYARFVIGYLHNRERAGHLPENPEVMMSSAIASLVGTYYSQLPQPKFGNSTGKVYSALNGY